MYQAHREERNRARELMNRAKQIALSNSLSVAHVQHSLVEEALAYERLWEVRNQPWLILESIQTANPELQDSAILYQYQHHPKSGELQLQELQAERAYQDSYKTLVIDCNYLEEEISSYGSGPR